LDKKINLPKKQRRSFINRHHKKAESGGSFIVYSFLHQILFKMLGAAIHCEGGRQQSDHSLFP
jgi:hypothetical protein